MAIELAQIAAGLPLAVSFAFAGGISSLREGRRRSALNEAVHELRRPLQALALAATAHSGDPIDSSLRMATVALERLDREINGDGESSGGEAVAVRPLAEAAVRRWEPRAALAGRSLRLVQRGESPMLPRGGFEVAQALDSLIINGIEHGSGEVVVEVCAEAEKVYLVVRDSGGQTSPHLLRSLGLSRIAGRNRHGHGLRVVRRTAAELGGGFELRRNAAGTAAVLELPTQPDDQR
ncbi:MAG TPA: ATP-binding protein [Solirubrobacterales bacterium]|jgi:signal transduction histidine kinase|nr:ATP-binding protein [Solirubrobacterales bacterium]